MQNREISMGNIKQRVDFKENSAIIKIEIRIERSSRWVSI